MCNVCTFFPHLPTFCCHLLFTQPFLVGIIVLHLLKEFVLLLWFILLNCPDTHQLSPILEIRKIQYTSGHLLFSKDVLNWKAHSEFYAKCLQFFKSVIKLSYCPIITLFGEITLWWLVNFLLIHCSNSLFSARRKVWNVLILVKLALSPISSKQLNSGTPENYPRGKISHIRRTGWR